MLAVLLDRPFPEGCWACNTSFMPGVEEAHGLRYSGLVDTVTAVRRRMLNKRNVNQELADMFENLLQTAWFKLRHARPCVLSNVRWNVKILEDDEAQVMLTASAVSLEPDPSSESHRSLSPEPLFPMDEQPSVTSEGASCTSHAQDSSSVGCVVTPLNFVPGESGCWQGPCRPYCTSHPLCTHVSRLRRRRDDSPTLWSPHTVSHPRNHHAP